MIVQGVFSQQLASSPTPSGDPYWENVITLLHFDGDDGSTQITDSSIKNKQVSTYGQAHIESDKYKFGGSSLQLSVSSSDYVNISDSSDYNFGSDDFTIEMFVYLESLNSLSFILETRNGSNHTNYYYIAINNIDGRFFFQAGGTQMICQQQYPLNQWVHVAITRIGDVFRIFQNGISVYQQTHYGIQLNSNGNIGMGRLNLNSTTRFNGYIDEFRVTRGIARYTENFTPPSEPFPDPEPSVFAHVVSQLHFDGNFTDVKDNTWTVYGPAYLETTDPIYGSGSLRPTSSGGIFTADLPELELGAQDFTLEFFAKQISASSSTFIEKRGAVGDRAFSLLYSTTSDRVFFNYYEDGTTLKQAQSRVFTWASGETRHIAVVCVDGVIAVYVDGQLGDGVTNTVTTIYDSTEPLRIGTNPLFTQTNTHLIDEFRLVKGIGIYKSDFTVPAMPFPDQ